MKSVELKIARIGNSKGIRLPAGVLKRYRMGATVIMEEKAEGIVLRPSGQYVEKLPWPETAAEMAAAGEIWDEWDAASGDGLEGFPWDDERPRRVAEKPSSFGRERRSVSIVKRYEIRWASLNPGRGAEMSKSRPVVIVSLDELNAKLQTVTVCRMTTQIHPAWRSRLQVECGGLPAEIAVDQIRTISRARLGKKIGSLSDDEAAALRRLIAEMYGA